jgi:hypothetical protein
MPKWSDIIITLEPIILNANKSDLYPTVALSLAYPFLVFGIIRLRQIGIRVYFISLCPVSWCLVELTKFNGFFIIIIQTIIKQQESNQILRRAFIVSSL